MKRPLTLNDFSMSYEDKNARTPARKLKRQTKALFDFLSFWLLVALITVFFGALWADKVLLVEPAHASEPHDNAYYCAHLGDYTNGADAVLAEICQGV